MREALLRKKADLETLLGEANKILTEAPQLRDLGWQELEVRIHLLEAMLLLVQAELSRAPA
jgi:hypothetical protein